jgi:hypothetical protein
MDLPLEGEYRSALLREVARQRIDSLNIKAPFIFGKHTNQRDFGIKTRSLNECLLLCKRLCCNLIQIRIFIASYLNKATFFFAVKQLDEVANNWMMKFK